MISIETQELAEKANSWPFVEARHLRDRLIKFNSLAGLPNEQPVLFETGYGPSGLPHIGTFGNPAKELNLINLSLKFLASTNGQELAFSASS